MPSPADQALTRTSLSWFLPSENHCSLTARVLPIPCDPQCPPRLFHGQVAFQFGHAAHLVAPFVAHRVNSSRVRCASDSDAAMSAIFCPNATERIG